MSRPARFDRACAHFIAIAACGGFITSREESDATEAVTNDRLNMRVKHAMRSRAIIEQVKGVMMVRFSCDANRASGMLRAASQSRNRKVSDVALEFVPMGLESP